MIHSDKCNGAARYKIKENALLSTGIVAITKSQGNTTAKHDALLLHRYNAYR